VRWFAVGPNKYPLAEEGEGGQVRLLFGSYKGELLSAVPGYWLKWAASQPFVPADLRVIFAEAAQAQGEVLPTIDELAEGFRRWCAGVSIPDLLAAARLHTRFVVIAEGELQARERAGGEVADLTFMADEGGTKSQDGA